MSIHGELENGSKPFLHEQNEYLFLCASCVGVERGCHTLKELAAKC